MLITNKLAKNGDPSADLQEFKHLELKVLCCRYWWLEIWKGERMSFPFWRLYWNKNEGAYVLYNQKIKLMPDHLYLIPPHTPFSADIENKKRINETSNFFFKYDMVHSKADESYHLKKGNILHFFTHFTLGASYDNVLPGIYPLKKNEDMADNLNKILDVLINGSKKRFTQAESLYVYNLILSSLESAVPYLPVFKNSNHKIACIKGFMERNINIKMTNMMLAKKIDLSAGAFSKLFKTYTGMNPSHYLRKIRIEKSCSLLLNTNITIDLIAEKCGFSDRYHLTKVFTMEKKITPAAFRKHNGYL